MRALKIVSTVLLLAISLCAQGQKPAEKSSDVFFQEIKFVGVRQVPPAALRKIAAHYYEGQQLDYSQLPELEERVRDLYMQYGFYKAQITRVGTGTTGFRTRPTPIVYEVVEGRRYRLGTIRFENGKAFAPVVLRPLFPMHAGEIFNTAKVRTGLENLRRVYGTRGYINFTPVPDTSVDDDAGTVSLIIDLDEGKQFRIGSVKIFGLDWDRTARLLCGWPQKPGTIFRTDLIETFFRRNKAWLSQEALSRMEIVRDEKASTVDVLLNFSSGNAPGVEVEARPEIVYVPEKKLNH